MACTEKNRFAYTPFLENLGLLALILMSAIGYERKFWGPLISVRFTPESRHTEAQCPLLRLKRTICGRVIDVGL